MAEDATAIISLVPVEDDLTEVSGKELVILGVLVQYPFLVI